MQAELTGQFPDTFNRVEVGTIIRQKVESIRTLQIANVSQNPLTSPTYTETVENGHVHIEGFADQVHKLMVISLWRNDPMGHRKARSTVIG